MTTLSNLLTRCSNALGDPLTLTWSRATLTYWAIEAIREFPILRPMEEQYVVVSATHSFTLPADFVELIWVEYPTSQDPPAYLKYKSHLDPEFWGSDEYYDVDRDYNLGSGYTLWSPSSCPGHGQDLLSCRHDDDLAEADSLTIPDRYLNITVMSSGAPG
jgi:hypothetical protein